MANGGSVGGSGSASAVLGVNGSPGVSESITREAVEALASEQGKPVLAVLTDLQAAAAVLDNEAALDALCAIKAEILGLDEEAA